MYVVGRVPSNLARVDVRFGSGDVVPAMVGGGFFGYFDPGVPHDPPQVAIVTEAGTYVMFPRSMPTETTNAPRLESCPADIRQMLRTAPDLDAVQRAQQPALLLTDDSMPTRVYAADQVIVQCGSAIHAWFPADPFSEQTGELSVLLYSPVRIHGLVVGHAPAGTEQVEVLLTDGTRVPATLTDGFYHAAWLSTTPIEEVVAYTSTTVYTRVHGATHTVPR